MEKETIAQVLHRAILRSERAYQVYRQNRLYHQARHILHANEHVYELLDAYAAVCDPNDLQQVFQYMFHLEDWFAQFAELETQGPELEEEFVFESLTNGIRYPSDFKNLIK